MKTQQVFVEDVDVGERARQLNPERIEKLADSMKRIGLQYPISVWSPDSSTMQLVAGRHRLEAAKHLGWQFIDAVLVEMSETQRQIWERVENLQRVGLTKNERDEHLRALEKLWPKLEEEERAAEVQSPQTAVFESKREDGRGHRPKGIASKIAEATGLSDDTVRRALADKEDRERRSREAAERHREAKEVADRARIEACDMLLDKLSLRDWERLIDLIEAAGGSLRASDLRKWQAPSGQAA